MSSTILSLGILTLAAILALLSQKFKQPIVLGQILIGSIFAIFGHYHIDFFYNLIHNKEIKLIAELGSIFLLFEIGLESNILELRKSGKSAIIVALLGVIIPFCLGFYLITPIILKSDNFNLAFFIGSMLAVTSTSISVSVFKELKIIKNISCQIVLAASVIDDIFGLIFLSLVIAIATNGHIDFVNLLKLIYQVCIFFISSIILGRYILPRLVIPNLRFLGTGNNIVTLIIVSICLIMAWYAQYIGLATIIGAFTAGLMLNNKTFINSHLLKKPKFNYFEHNLQLIKLITPLGRILTPVFFIYAGMQVDIVSAFKINTIVTAILISIAAIVGKSLCGMFLPKGINKLIVGFGMIPRGEIGIIFAITGFELGVINNDLFAALLLMVVITSIITPILLTKIQYQIAK